MRKTIWWQLLTSSIRQFLGGLTLGLLGLVQFFVPDLNAKWTKIEWPWWIIIGLIIILWGVLINAKTRINMLEKEIQRINESKPVIKVGFLNGTALDRKLTVKMKKRDEAPDYKRLTEERKIEIEKKGSKRYLEGDYNIEKTVSDLIISIQNNNDRYEQDLEEYLSDYTRFLEENYRYMISEDRVVDVNIGVSNNWKKPADDVVIKLIFPKSFREATSREVDWHKSYFDKDEYGYFKTKKPKAPKEPKRFKSMAEMFSFGDMVYMNPGEYIDPATDMEEWPSISMNQEGRMEIIYDFDRLIPDYLYDDIKELSLWLGEFNSSEMFEIDVEIFSGNLPKATKEKIQIDLIIIADD